MARKSTNGRSELPASAISVGYGRPPKYSQFKPGQSGNPAGRPKGRRNLHTELIEELNETVDFTEKGEKKKITKARAIIKAVVAKAAGGDIRILAMIVEKLLVAQLDPDAAAEEGIGQSDQAILERFGIRSGATSSHNETADE
jgi:hypothetical protein